MAPPAATGFGKVVTLALCCLHAAVGDPNPLCGVAPHRPLYHITGRDMGRNRTTPINDMNAIFE